MICQMTKKERAELLRLLDVARQSLSDLAEYANDIVDQWQIALDGRSDAWCESLNGLNAADRLDKLRGWIASELPGDDLISEPPKLVVK